MEETFIVLSDISLRSEWCYWWVQICTVYRGNVAVLQTLCKWTLHVI